MEKFTGTTIQEFIKWVTENWEEIEAAFEKICEKYLKEQRENLTDYSLPCVSHQDNWTLIRTDNETVFSLPNPKNTPIKICFTGDSLGEVDYKEIIDKAFKEEN